MTSGLSKLDIAAIISPETGHVQIPMSRLAGARVIWVNPRAEAEDPSYRALGERSSYEAHLLESCAFTVATAEVQVPDAIGIADRYGGDGIGSNGGSGRAVYINGYHVKGVGRTPLVGLGTDATHASGGAYLEECVRESIFAELVHLEFPHGSVPTLAIIDTGREVTWNTDAGPKRERMCLLVRPMFLRPAHIERAVRYKSGDEYEGATDAARARNTALAMEHQVGGAAAMDDLLRVCLERWARQIAYSYVSRLSHGGVTSSNVSIDGRLVDFGAMAALPTLGKYWIASGASPTGEQYKDVEASAKSLSASMAFVFGNVERARTWRAAALSAITESYFGQVHDGVLRIAGLRDTELQQLRGCEDYAKLRRAIHQMIVGELSHQYTIFAGMPSRPATSINAAKLVELRTWARSVCQAQGTGAADDVAGELDTSSIDKALAPRTGLERERIKKLCYERLDGRELSADELRIATASLIQEVVQSEGREGWPRGYPVTTEGSEGAANRGTSGSAPSGIVAGDGRA